jgi:hypothetical protein
VDAEPGAIEMQTGLPVIQNPAGTAESCTHRCPTGAIQWIDGDQFAAGAGGHG